MATFRGEDGSANRSEGLNRLVQVGDFQIEVVRAGTVQVAVQWVTVGLNGNGR